jgi:uncharacterized metal-binding protein YceD (DUF177 family)
MTTDLNWRESVTISDLPPQGKDYELVPDAGARAELAKRAGVLDVLKLIAKLKVLPQGKAGAVLEGSLQATVKQTCIVTLEPFDNYIDETISLAFEPEAVIAARGPMTEEVVGDDPPEPIVDGAIDLAVVVAEFLTLSIDPYPRKPDAVFDAPPEEEEEKEASPFAALAKLKSGQDDKKQ